MLDWHSCQICYPLEMKILLLFVASFKKMSLKSHFILFFS